jgi:fucose permease
MTPIARPFVRDSFTWLAYALLSYYAYLQSALGPLMPFLAAELDLTYTVRALHLSAFALGMVIAGTTGDRAASRFGRRRLFWGGGAGMVMGVLLLIFGQNAIFTIGGTFVMGWLGSYLLVMIQATLSDHHGENRPIALTESNVYAVMLAAVAPAVVSWQEGTGSDLGWRMAMIFAVVTYIIAMSMPSIQKIRIPGEKRKNMSATTPSATNAPLPRVFWAYWVFVFFGVAIEWAIIFWSSDFLERVVGLPRVEAAGATSMFLGGMVFGRIAGSRLSARYPSTSLLFVAVGLVIIAFPIFWLARDVFINLMALFVMGVGTANLFPLVLTEAVTVGDMNVNKASARISQAAGFAILIPPLILGTLADQIEIFAAFALVGIFAVICLLLLIGATVMRRTVSTTTPAV